MDPSALRVIQAEHQALAAMLRSLLMLIQRSKEERKPPPFDVLRAMLFYIDEFPERAHHPKEELLLFPQVRARRPDLAPVLDALNDDHQRGEAAVRSLQHKLTAWEMLGESRREAFEREAQTYVDGYLRHMSVEERQIIPAARLVLTDDEWRALNTGFEANRDPLAGHPPEKDFEPLFRRIVDTAPAPVGLG